MKQARSLSGALVVDKPEGPSSHDIVKTARKHLGARVGHTGTLDPLATGVLPLLIGPATRLMRFLQNDDKVYWCQVRLGQSTDTYDREGEVVKQAAPPGLSVDDCRQLLGGFLGEIEQVPPMYSAVRVAGQRLYELARKGEVKDRPARKVRIDSIDLLEQQPDLWTLRLTCSSGTYVRTLAHDIGERLGCGAHLQSLCRERSGQFVLSQAITPQAPPQQWLQAVIPMEELLPHFPRLDLQPPESTRVRHGNPIAVPEGREAEFYRLFVDGLLAAVARRKLQLLHPFVVLNPL